MSMIDFVEMFNAHISTAQQASRNVLHRTDDHLFYCGICDSIYEFVLKLRSISLNGYPEEIGGMVKYSPYHIPKMGKAEVVCPNCVHGANTLLEGNGLGGN